jgi:hypothetical protein
MMNYFDTQGFYHKTNGPAKIWSTDAQEWIYHGRRHRYYGPSRIWKDGNEHWYLNHKRVK